MRLDEYLVYKKNVKSRNLAKQYIINGNVKVNDIIILKPSYEINLELLDHYHISITNEMKYVSRAGYKLEKALDYFKLDVKDKIVVDIGASTGGFSDCCLQYGAKKIYCVDVGSNQLDQKIANNPKVVNLENTNIKDLNPSLISDQIDIIVSDLSFISSRYMFENINKLNLSPHTNLITLIKPQFELDNSIVKQANYCIKDKKYLQKAIDNVRSYAIAFNWKVIDVIDSPIKGAKKENQEYLMWCCKNG